MKTNLNALLLVLVAEATFQALTDENKQLREHAASYDRLRAMNGDLKGRVAQLENRIASADDTTRHYWTLIQGHVAEINQLKQQVLELGRQNIALAAEAEGRELTEQQLAAADARIRELEAALVLANLPAGSRDNVIQMVREAA